jgi:hypothetical protein
LEASRAPYSKSHARRLKRREKEQLTAGGLGSLKAALPSIAPTTTTTRTTAATVIGDRPAGELDAAATTTAAAIIDAFASASESVKPINESKSKSKSKQPATTDQSEVPPPPPPPSTTRPGQIGECHGAPLMRSQGRRRALYGHISLPTVILRLIIDCGSSFLFLFFFFGFSGEYTGRPNVSVNP